MDLYGHSPSSFLEAWLSVSVPPATDVFCTDISKDQPCLMAYNISKYLRYLKSLLLFSGQDVVACRELNF